VLGIWESRETLDVAKDFGCDLIERFLRLKVLLKNVVQLANNDVIPRR
jgi:hypothetical protein